MKLHILAKCSDCCSATIPERGLEKQGYVPRGLGIGGGDYIDLTIGTDTGKIEGWKKPTESALRSAFPKVEKKT